MGFKVRIMIDIQISPLNRGARAPILKAILEAILEAILTHQNLRIENQNRLPAATLDHT
jgi:hypothetical protein